MGLDIGRYLLNSTEKSKEKFTFITKALTDDKIKRKSELKSEFSENQFILDEHMKHFCMKMLNNKVSLQRGTPTYSVPAQNVDRLHCEALVPRPSHGTSLLKVNRVLARSVNSCDRKVNFM